jgi:hypothetical protein
MQNIMHKPNKHNKNSVSVEQYSHVAYRLVSALFKEGGKRG